MKPIGENEWVTGQITLEIDGAPLDMSVTVPSVPVKPQRMLPIFQQMTNSFVELGVRSAEFEGRTVSCTKGCGACCSQPVPIAEIEAYQIAELVENMPEPRRSEVKERFEAAFAHFAEIGWFEQLSLSAGGTKMEQEEVVLAYFRENIPCPFLLEGACSIHKDRPLACREYLVSSPPEHCKNPTADTIKMIIPPVKPSKTLLSVGQKRQITGINFIPLVMSLRWAESNEDTFEEKTGERWLADFFEKLTKKEIPKSENP